MRKGAPIAAWMPVEIEPLMSDPALNTWFDEQKWWYMALLFRAWQHVDNPCHLPNDSDKLRTLAGVPISRKRQWAERCGEVLAKFNVSSDGLWIFNRKQLEVYTNQLAKRDARKDAAYKRWELERCKTDAMHMQCNASVSLSKNSDSSSSLKNPEDWISKIRALGKWRDGDSVTAEHSFFEQVADKGVDPAKLFEAVCRIYVATDSGKFAPKLAEVIRRWQEPLEFWGRDGKSRGNTVADFEPPKFRARKACGGCGEPIEVGEFCSEGCQAIRERCDAGEAARIASAKSAVAP